MNTIMIRTFRTDHTRLPVSCNSVHNATSLHTFRQHPVLQINTRPGHLYTESSSAPYNKPLWTAKCLHDNELILQFHSHARTAKVPGVAATCRLSNGTTWMGTREGLGLQRQRYRYRSVHGFCRWRRAVLANGPAGWVFTARTSSVTRSNVLTVAKRRHQTKHNAVAALVTRT
jgi:hypothetical protein